ncbi:hypothetical protein [Hymenobacter sediminicola]|uniref:CD-NTase-associated protein 16 NUDIX domain-containing protein n=1 Tax=Hymenobacter sediminicola TaxID=2761579 RepID=A0A7G7W8T2_9BACT|nr:hypothetical protein [Hymenobacter sediminicola]QNH62775.1 hypothetical protein H4317_02845 [Hymenobacter sediminicola]
MSQATKTTLALLLVIPLSVTVVFLIQVYPQATSPWAALGVSLLVNLISTPVFAALVEMFYNLHRFPLWFKARVIYRNQEVRLSISYLFRIKVKGKYLLVKNRKRDYYQLVGGAYKAFPGAIKVFNKYHVKPDKQFATDHGIAKSDLRFLVRGWWVLKMLDWFQSQKDRETNQWREFCEELLTTDILPKHEFRYVDYTYACTVQAPMRRAKRLPNQEILLFEIYDLLPNIEQQASLEALFAKGDTDNVKWASAELIDSLGTDHRTEVTAYDIGPHTKWALNEKWTDD